MEELRSYFVYLTNEKKAARASITIALCGIKFLYEQVLHEEWQRFGLGRPQKEHKLPVVLSVEEVRRALAAVKRAPYRVCLSTLYACGLRLQEGLPVHASGLPECQSCPQKKKKGLIFLSPWCKIVPGVSIASLYIG